MKSEAEFCILVALERKVLEGEFPRRRLLHEGKKKELDEGKQRILSSL